MSGKAKSVYLTVSPVGKLNRVFTKMFFNAKEQRDYVNTDEFKALYPAELFYTVVETY